MGKIKTYVLMLSEFFPKAHSKAGEPTNFFQKFMLGQKCLDCKETQDFSGMSLCKCNVCERPYLLTKLHTIRANYLLWEKRIKEILEGHAVLSVRQWSGKSYRSKQIEIARLTADNGIGIQKLRIYEHEPFPVVYADRYTTPVDWQELANNDGLSLNDWREWFKGYDLSKPMAIIHFTKFRY